MCTAAVEPIVIPFLPLRQEYCRSNGAASAAVADELFEPDVPLLLPSEAALCLRLPLIFNAAGKPLLTAATAADESLARKAVLLPHWLCAAGTADAPADA